MQEQPAATQETDMRERLRHALAHFEHVLPGQAPIKDFVHHNTLHGFQHLEFTQALAEAERITGARGFLPLERFREFYKQGRIVREDLEQAMHDTTGFEPDAVIHAGIAGTLSRRDVLIAALLHPIKKLTGCQLNWQIEEMQVLTRFQSDVDSASRRRLMESAARQGLNNESEAIADLWSACLQALGLEFNMLHPEELMDLSPEQVEQILSQFGAGDEPAAGAHVVIRKQVAKALDQLLQRVGPELTLRGLLLRLTGKDLLEDIRPLIIRHLANHLDQGMAAWHAKDRPLGFYTSWRQSAALDLTGLFADLPEWLEEITILDEDPMETVISELQRLQLPEDRWEQYLERLALELPGWSGMFYWHHSHPGYKGFENIPVDMVDYLAVRLVLDRLFAQQLCRQQWQVAPSLDMLRWHFRRHRSEFMVRDYLNNQHLPEYLASQAQRLVNQTVALADNYQHWERLADMIWTWRHSPSADLPEGHSVYSHGWKLFRLSQHLGLSGEEIRCLSSTQVESLFNCLDQLTPDKAAFLWLQAYEHHYREQIFNAIVNNEGRGQWKQREQRPAAQIVWCMDDREEAIRRHLEAINPQIETFGAAAHYNVPHNWRGLDDQEITGLCPVVMVPSHEIKETPKPANEALAHEHGQRHKRRLWLKNLIHQETRRNLLASTAIMLLAAPASLAVLIAKALTPLGLSNLSNRLRERYEMQVPTDISLTAAPDAPEGTIEHNRLGFSLEEQTDRIETFLQNIGLVDGFSRLPIIMGHGSSSENNPHRAAYDCGACSGRHSGPNARILAAIGNRPEVREELRKRAIDIPGDCWFVGAFHNTCNEQIDWLDLDRIPATHRQELSDIRSNIDQACHLSAHERCRKFFSAPKHPDQNQALTHIQGRSWDFSQARPELGHATNACAVIGRRSITQGAFFDRRAFLISYDPTKDPSGAIIERLLLANGPVGAGISLEYYFSTVNNEEYGCGTKVLHNITGLFGVMEGASSDLRTGLPRQMIEIHEAMRLQVLVEAKIDLLTEIYMRQPPLQELVGKGWLLLSAKDPDSERIDVFYPDKGWVRWTGQVSLLPIVKHSVDWYAGHMDPLTPVLLQQPEVTSHA
ncbi:MAG: DUF2309 domain-containing protein [Pseudomonadota bacterium]